MGSAQLSGYDAQNALRQIPAAEQGASNPTYRKLRTL
jgi:hypothetical protein